MIIRDTVFDELEWFGCLRLQQQQAPVAQYPYGPNHPDNLLIRHIVAGGANGSVDANGPPVVVQLPTNVAAGQVPGTIVVHHRHEHVTSPNGSSQAPQKSLVASQPSQESQVHGHHYQQQLLLAPVAGNDRRVASQQQWSQQGMGPQAMVASSGGPASLPAQTAAPIAGSTPAALCFDDCGGASAAKAQWLVSSGAPASTPPAPIVAQVTMVMPPRRQRPLSVRRVATMAIALMETVLALAGVLVFVAVLSGTFPCCCPWISTHVI